MVLPKNVKTAEDFQTISQRTMSTDLTKKELVTLCAMGISGEAGEVTDYLKKVIFHNHEADKDIIKKELGDVLWYIANLATVYDLGLTEIMQANVDKLRNRYPEGFSTEKSINRTV
jgi:NTP pyrophosphatase (non-canonical NTP hydrolase)